MVDTAIKSDPKSGPWMLTQDESHRWGNHTIGPNIMENVKEYSTALWRNIRLRYCAKLSHCVNLYEESRTIFPFAIRNYYFFNFSEYYEEYESLSCFVFSSCSINNFVLTVGTIKKVSFFLMSVTDMLSMNLTSFGYSSWYLKKIRVRAVWTRRSFIEFLQ